VRLRLSGDTGSRILVHRARPETAATASTVTRTLTRAIPDGLFGLGSGCATPFNEPSLAINE